MRTDAVSNFVRLLLIAFVIVVWVPLRSPRTVAAAMPCAAGGVNNATPVPGALRIHDIQGSSHVSPCKDQDVFNVPGVVTALRGDGFWMQDPEPDADNATSEGILVFAGTQPLVSELGAERPVEVGDALLVSGTVTEFLPGGETANLTTTEIVDPVLVLTELDPVVATILGPGDRMPPTDIIDDDGASTYEPASDGLDFWESLEGMFVRVDDALVTGYQLRFGELPIVAAAGVGASGVTPRGGIAVGGGAAGADLNPELAFLDSDLLSGDERFPLVDTGARIPGPVEGVVDYSRRRFRILPSTAVTIMPSTLLPEEADPAGDDELSIASFNILNFHPGETDRYAPLANIIVHNLASPDLLVLQEVQDNSGPIDNGITAADETYGALIEAIKDAGGPTYTFKDVPPEDGASGGEDGGNIRVGFLYQTEGDLALVSRAGDPALGVQILAGPELSISPGPVLADTTHPDAFLESRLPLAGEFTFNGHPLFVIGNHFASRGGSSALYGSTQPPVEGSKSQRLEQAEVVASLVDDILAEDEDAMIVVLGDFNDFYMADPLQTLKAAGLSNLMESLPSGERYTYVFEGNSQAIDHMLVSPALEAALVPKSYDIVHVDAEFYDPIHADDPDVANPPSDHDPQVARFFLPGS